ncbi:MAG: zinc-binding alcohol dehydrogenase family protein [Proteobacteria bacterium]|nr:zinc-binding alcohol dehydrogenase family protein [Pseudomonadota bacterium]
MKAIVQTVFGGPEVLGFEEVPKPVPGEGDLLVRVRAIGVNPVDSKMRRAGAAGAAVPNPPRILGWDAAGVAESVGAGVRDFRAGDEVWFAGDVRRPGSYAEFVAVDARLVARKPATLAFEDAAAIPLTAITVWEAILETFRLAPGEGKGRTLLIVGGAGGVGSLAIQVAKKVCALTVIATASRPESVARCQALGADAVIDHTQPLATQLKASGFSGADYIFHTGTLEAMPALAEALNPFGHICAIQGGPTASQVNVGLLMPKRGTLSFEAMFARAAMGTAPERQGALLAKVARLVDAGTLVGTRTTTLPWREVQEAHRRIDTAHTLGKIVLRPD